MRLNFNIFVFFVFLVINSYGFAQTSNYSNIIFIDVNSLVNAKNCNSVLSDQLITTEQRCIAEIRKLILQKPNETFLVIYLNDNENKSHFNRKFSAKDGGRYLKDSLANFRNISSSNIPDNKAKVDSLIIQLNVWNIDIASFNKMNMFFFFGCDINQSEIIKLDYIQRFLKLIELVDFNNLIIKSGFNTTLYVNNGNDMVGCCWTNLALFFNLSK